MRLQRIAFAAALAACIAASATHPTLVAGTSATRRAAGQPTPSSAAHLVTHSVESGGIERSYAVYLPDQREAGARGVVLDLHGSGSHPAQELIVSGLAAVAEERGLAVLLPATGGPSPSSPSTAPRTRSTRTGEAERRTGGTASTGPSRGGWPGTGAPERIPRPPPGRPSRGWSGSAAPEARRSPSTASTAATSGRGAPSPCRWSASARHPGASTPRRRSWTSSSATGSAGIGMRAPFPGGKGGRRRRQRGGGVALTTALSDATEEPPALSWRTPRFRTAEPSHERARLPSRGWLCCCRAYPRAASPEACRDTPTAGASSASPTTLVRTRPAWRRFPSTAPARASSLGSGGKGIPRPPARSLPRPCSAWRRAS